MGILEGESRMTMSVYRLCPNGKREDIKPRREFELGDPSRGLPRLGSVHSYEPQVGNPTSTPPK